MFLALQIHAETITHSFIIESPSNNNYNIAGLVILDNNSWALGRYHSFWYSNTDTKDKVFVPLIKGRLIIKNDTYFLTNIQGERDESQIILNGESTTFSQDSIFIKKQCLDSGDARFSLFFKSDDFLADNKSNSFEKMTPLLIVNDSIMDASDLNLISADHIDSIKIIEITKAIETYGARARYGAVDVKLKENKYHLYANKFKEKATENSNEWQDFKLSSDSCFFAPLFDTNCNGNSQSLSLFDALRRITIKKYHDDYLLRYKDNKHQTIKETALECYKNLLEPSVSNDMKIYYLESNEIESDDIKIYKTRADGIWHINKNATNF